MTWSGPDGGSVKVLEALPTAVLVVTPQGKIRYANARAVAILGRSNEALVGRGLETVLGSTTLAADAEHRGEHILELPGGARRTIGYTSAPLDGSGDTAVVFQDISEVTKLRDERDKLMSLAAIGEALPSLLHELKNPLAAVTTAVEVLVEEVQEREVVTQLHAVLSELRRMALGFEGIGAVHRDLRARRHAAIDYACAEACRVLAPRAKNAGLRFSWFIRDMPLLPLDPSVVRALVFNFVTNAIHASNRDDAIRLHAQLDSRRNTLELNVVDTGAGMTPEVLEQASQLFFTTKASGSGIGLALCRRAIEDAGGQMTLTSVLGFGTRVAVSVPIERPTNGSRPERG